MLELPLKKKAYRVNLLALGDVGSTLAIGLRLMAKVSRPASGALRNSQRTSPPSGSASRGFPGSGGRGRGVLAGDLRFAGKCAGTVGV